MRIRKHAAKLLLGSACPPPQQYSPPPPPAAVADDEYDQQSVGDNGLFLCQLNCSPWDVLDFNHYYFHQQEEAEEDEGKGLMGNVLGFGDEEGIFEISEAFSKSVLVAAAALYLDCEEEDNSDHKKKVKKRRRRKKKEIKVENDDDKDDVKTSSVVTVIAKSGGGGGGGDQLVPGICKKKDGKGWHCSRPANPNHTLCDHHLTQLKSYSSTRYNNNINNTVAVAESEPNATTQGVKNHNKPDHVRSPVKHPRRKTKTKAAATSVKSDGDGYYYYSGFGLSRGKGRSNGRNEDAKVEEVSAGGHNGSNSGDDGSDAPIAGGDLDDDTDDDEPVGNVDNNKGILRRKKKGRKPIKARSLKSLL